MSPLTNISFALILVAAIAFPAYYLGGAHKQATLEKEWQGFTVKVQEEHSRLTAELAVKQAHYQAETQRINDELTQATAQFEGALRAVHDQYAVRLHNSETRASVYQRQAKGGAAERDALAEHASRLDRSLEEGRRLVADLRYTLEQRERALHAVGQQLLQDRKLLIVPL